MSLNELKVICRIRTDGDWEYIATAAGDKKSIIRSRKVLCISELGKGWDGKLIKSRADITDRFFSLSVSDISYLSTLWDEIKHLPLINSFLETAYYDLKHLFEPDPVQPLEGKWEWHENLKIFPTRVKELRITPILNKTLSYEDLHMAIYGGFRSLTFYSLIGQQVKIDVSVFRRFMENSDDLDGGHLACLISAGEYYGLERSAWCDLFMQRIRHTTDPIELTPAIYLLLSPNWQMIR